MLAIIDGGIFPMKNQHFNWISVVGKKVQALAKQVILRFPAPLVPLRRWLRRWLFPHKISLCRIEGVVKGGDETLSLLCGAADGDKNYLLQLMFDGAARMTGLGQVRLRDVFCKTPAPEHQAALVLLETTPPLHEWRDDGSWFFIPTWVSGEVHLPLGERWRKNDTLQTIRRRIRKHGFELVVTRDEEHFKDFFHNMYMPYATRTYGSTARCHSYDEMWAKRKDCDLLLIQKKNQPGLFLAAQIIINEPTGPRMWSLGVRDGNKEYVREGALAALYHFSFGHLLKEGFTKVNLGWSRPFLKDGVLQFKKRLSQTVNAGRWQGFSLKISSLTPAVKSFLVNNPFIFLANGRLHGAVFAGTPLTLDKVTELDHEFFHPGMARLCIYHFGLDRGFEASCLLPDLAARVVLLPVTELISGNSDSGLHRVKNNSSSDPYPKPGRGDGILVGSA